MTEVASEPKIAAMPYDDYEIYEILPVHAVKHLCEPLAQSRHLGQKHRQNGPAINEVWLEDECGWVAGNGEYATVIHFCPFCGDKLDGKHTEHESPS